MDDDELSYEELKPFGCKECSNSFKTKHSLKLHTNLIHSKGSFECSKCDFRCDRIGKMTFHMQRHLQNERHPKLQDENEVQARIPSIVIKLGNNKLYINHNSVAESQEEIENTFPKNEFDSKFIEQKNIRVNKALHRSNGNFSCELCKKRFTRRVRFQKHMIIKHTDIRSIEEGPKVDGKHLRCLICHKRFSRKGILKRHMLNHTGEKLFECTKCEAKFNQKIKLHQHMMKYHENSPWRCNKCDESFTQCIQLQRHMETHSITQTFTCTKCDKSFTTSKDLKRHKILVHIKKETFQSKKQANKLVLKRFVSKSTKKQNHTTININITVNSEKPVSTERSLKCMKCQESVKFSELRAHMDMHQNAFRCEDCNRIFLSQHSLKIHQAKAHRDLDKEAENENSIKQEALGHSLRSQNIHNIKAEKDYSEDPNLELDSGYNTNLNEEIVANISHIVNDEKKFSCEICHRVFNTLRSVNIHTTKAHKGNYDDRERVSEEENKNTLNEDELNKTSYIGKVKDQMDFKCEICDKIFHSMRSVNIHKAKAHKEYTELNYKEDNTNNIDEEDGGYDSYIDQDQIDYKCEICDKIFHSIQSVNIHKSRAHKEFIPNVILKRLTESTIENHKYKKEPVDSDYGYQMENSDFEDFKFENKKWQVKSCEEGGKLKIKLQTSTIER